MGNAKHSGASVHHDCDGRQQGTSEQRIRLVIPRLPQARIIHECRREAFETEARRGFSQVRPPEAYVQSVEETERENPHWVYDRQAAQRLRPTGRTTQ